MGQCEELGGDAVKQQPCQSQGAWSWDGPFVLNGAGKPDLGSVHPSVTRHRLPLERSVTLTGGIALWRASPNRYLAMNCQQPVPLAAGGGGASVLKWN